MSARKTKPARGNAVATVRGKSLVVSETLHTALKEKARTEGRILQAMVEEKLSELIPQPQLELTASSH